MNICVRNYTFLKKKTPFERSGEKLLNFKIIRVIIYEPKGKVADASQHLKHFPIIIYIDIDVIRYHWSIDESTFHGIC